METGNLAGLSVELEFSADGQDFCEIVKIYLSDNKNVISIVE